MIKFGRLIVVVLNSNLTKLEASRTNYSATTSSNIHFSNGKNKNLPENDQYDTSISICFCLTKICVTETLAKGVNGDVEIFIFL